MKAFWNLVRHRYFKVAAIISLVLVLPVILISGQQQQDQRSSATLSTTLYFSPENNRSNPIVKNINDEFNLDVMLNPGKNLISLLKLDIEYDSNILTLNTENPLKINGAIFPEILEGPIYSEGRIQVVLSIGSDQTKVITAENRIMTINFVAKNSSNRTLINFGANNSAFSVGANDQSGEDVISSLTPAYIKINRATSKNINTEKAPKR